MTTKINIFDRKLLRKNRQRYITKFTEFDFLHKEAGQRIIEKLGDFNLDFKNILEIGARNGFLGKQISQLKNNTKVHHASASHAVENQGFSTYQYTSKDEYWYNEFLIQTDCCEAPDNKTLLIMDDEFLCFKEQSFDLIISNLNLHFINDILENLIQIKKALKKGGLFIATFFGGQNLKELRDIFYQIEIENYNGISPRIIPYIDVKDAGMLMQKAGFSEVVSEVEKITVSYQNPLGLLRDLKNMGEANMLFSRSKIFFTKKMLFSLEQLYQKLYSNSENEVDANFEIITIIGKN